MGVERIPESQRKRYAAEEPFDIGEHIEAALESLEEFEELLSKEGVFEDDGSGYCLLCRRSRAFHSTERNGVSYCMVIE